MGNDIELAKDLVRSPVRLEILQRLRDGTATRYELRDELDCSRTTVDRNLERLCKDGWIAQSNSGYELTTCGEIVLEKVTVYLETVDVAARLQPILRWIPRDAFDLDVRHLADAQITVAEEGQPIAMVDKHARVVSQSPEARLVTPIFSPQPLEAQYRNFSTEELDVEIVVPPSVASTFTDDEAVAEQLSEMRALGAMDVYVTDEPIPYFVGILGETVQIGVDEDGQPRGLLESEAEPVREWARERFEAYRRTAQPLGAWEGN